MARKLIEAIHNYCDRWCERCTFVDRCAVGVVEKKRWATRENQTEDELWREVHQNFQQALQLLDRMLRDAGLDPEEIGQQPDPEPNPDRQALQNRLRQKGTDYFKAVHHFLQTHEALLAEPGPEPPMAGGIPIELEGWNDRAAALETVRWYGPFIGVKASRAIGGLDNLALYDDPRQSDANGSAKITIIAIERSLLAWQMVRRHWPALADETLGLLLQLRDLRAEMIRLFPDWQAFVRPGFDTEGPQFEPINPN